MPGRVRVRFSGTLVQRALVRFSLLVSFSAPDATASIAADNDSRARYSVSAHAVEYPEAARSFPAITRRGCYSYRFSRIAGTLPSQFPGGRLSSPLVVSSVRTRWSSRRFAREGRAASLLHPLQSDRVRKGAVAGDGARHGVTIDAAKGELALVRVGIGRVLGNAALPVLPRAIQNAKPAIRSAHSLSSRPQSTCRHRIGKALVKGLTRTKPEGAERT
jgi:hypothetical protein